MTRLTRGLFLIALLLGTREAVAQSVGNFKRVIFAVDPRTIPSNGGGTPATLTLTPVGSYVTLNCQDTDGCTITMGESGIADGIPVFIVNVSANACTFADTSGVSELQGAFLMGQYEALALRYVSDRWVEEARGVSSTSVVTPASTTTLTNKTYNAESTGNLLTLPFTEWWPAAQANDTGAVGWAGWTYTTANFPTLARYDGSNVHAAVANFLDSETDNYYREFRLPNDWAGALDVTLFWRSTATSGNVVWQIATSCSADSETDDASWNTAQTITDTTKGTTSQLNAASLSTLTTTGCAAGELFHLKLFRDPTDGGDTLGATASFVGLEFTYRRAM